MRWTSSAFECPTIYSKLQRAGAIQGASRQLDDKANVWILDDLNRYRSIRWPKCILWLIEIKRIAWLDTERDTLIYQPFCFVPDLKCTAFEWRN